MKSAAQIPTMRDRSFKGMLCRLRVRQLYQIFIFTAVAWALATLYFYSSFNLDLSLDSMYDSYTSRGSPLSATILKSLMSLKGGKVITNPLLKFIRHEEEILHFYELPKRKLGMQYGEITSANRDTSYPLAPDFTFHIKYSDDHVVLYEDTGPGCVYRIYILPSLPTETSILHKMTSKDLAGSVVQFDIDGRSINFSLYHLAEGDEWPFMYPINAHRPSPSAGLSMYTPLCYQHSMKIAYYPQEKLPADLFEATVNCSKNDLWCPVRIYSAVSRHKFPMGTQVESFAHEYEAQQKHAVHTARDLLQQPEKYGPDRGERCVLECLILCKGCRQVLFMSKQAEVISTMKFRVFDAFTGAVVSNWSNVLLTVHLDGAHVPQFHKVPLGAIFGASGSLNDFMGAALGRRKKFCTYDDGISALASVTSTGYIYFPMPFWKEATIYIDGSDYIEQSVLVCMQINTVENFYDEGTTGYLHAVSTHYTDDVSGWRNVLSVQNMWGHLVGVMMEVDNLRAVRNVPVRERWATLQADAEIFTDGQKSALVLGTGLEDYFSYAHGFALAENTSYSFIGVPHTAPKRKEPLTWHCYRLQVLDPIPFSESLEFIMEGTGVAFHEPVTNITYENYLARNLQSKATISHLIFYYGKTLSQPSFSPVDKFIVANKKSEMNHEFHIIKRGNENSGELFALSDVRYLGACNTDQMYDVQGRIFNPEDRFQFSLQIQPGSKGITLRRTFHLVPKQWNQRAKVRINSIDYGEWYIPMGSLVSEYSLAQEDLILNMEHMQVMDRRIVVEIQPMTSWRDVSYESFVIN